MMQTATLTEVDEQEFDDMGSFNHSYVQGRLAYLFNRLELYAVLIELSLDASHLDKGQYDEVRGELVPDVCLYRKRSLSLPRDILRMTEMPLLIVEVVSPRQGIDRLIGKFEAYFALGIESCWLVNPLTRVVHVYTTPIEREIFSTGEVRDPKVGITLAVDEIFT